MNIKKDALYLLCVKEGKNWEKLKLVTSCKRHNEYIYDIQIWLNEIFTRDKKSSECIHNKDQGKKKEKKERKQ